MGKFWSINRTINHQASLTWENTAAAGSKNGCKIVGQTISFIHSYEVITVLPKYFSLLTIRFPIVDYSVICVYCDSTTFNGHSLACTGTA